MSHGAAFHLTGVCCLAIAALLLILLVRQERRLELLRKRDHQDGWPPWQGKAFRNEERQPLFAESVATILTLALLGLSLVGNQPVLAGIVLLFSIGPLLGIAIRLIKSRKE